MYAYKHQQYNASKLLSKLAALLLLISVQCHSFEFNNRYVRCGYKDNTIIKTCRYGGFIYNPDRNICSDSYYCYRGPGQSCNDNVEMRCEPGMVCQCGVCQNCNETNCKLKLCPTGDNNVLKRWIKRFENNLALDYFA